MIRLIHGEIYRILRKRAMYFYFGIVFLGFILVAYISSGREEQWFLSDANEFFSLLPIIVGAYVFTSVYTDDLASKSINTIVGYGLNKAKIIFAKFILMLIFNAVIFALLTLVYSGVYAFRHEIPPNQFGGLLTAALGCWLVTVVWTALSSIIVYGLQHVPFAIVAYFLLSFNIITMLISVVADQLGYKIDEYLPFYITSNIIIAITEGGDLATPIVRYAVYIALSVVLSILAFNKKEMEF